MTKRKRKKSKSPPNISSISSQNKNIVDLIHKNSEFKDIPPDKVNKLITVATKAIVSGPLPPPQILQAYQSILPRAPERIIKMAEEQASHRREIEKKIVGSDIKRVKLGQIFGFIISILGISSATICALVGQPFPASIIGSGGIITLVSLFVVEKKKRN